MVELRNFIAFHMIQRKVIASGENILDILFENGQPVSATPGGSAFNSAVSLALTGTNTYFMGETGDDETGKNIRNFMESHGIKTAYMQTRQNWKTAVALAFMDENHEAHYAFYRESPTPNPHFTIPEFQENDILLFGSYQAICPPLNQQTERLLTQAKASKALIYYDLNFRPSHRKERNKLISAVERNCRMANIVRASADDFEALFDERNLEKVYQKNLKSWCPILIGTAGPEDIQIFTPTGQYRFSAEHIQPVSTIGAGDNFNAGFIYALIRLGITDRQLDRLSAETWQKLVFCGTAFASHVCMRRENVISPDFDFENALIS